MAMTDAIRNVDRIISNMNRNCRIIYFKSERREIIETVINESGALRARLEKQFGRLRNNAGESLFGWMAQNGSCVRLREVYTRDKLEGAIKLGKESPVPMLLYITDFQVYDEKSRAYMIKAFLDCPETAHSLLLISAPGLYIPDGFGGYLELIQDSYISRHDIQVKLTKKVREEEHNRKQTFFTDKELEKFAGDFVGLTDQQVDSVLERLNGTLCTGLKAGKHRDCIGLEKKKEIEKDRTIVFRDVPQKTSVCGLGSFTRWLGERERQGSRANDFFDPEKAKKRGTPAPKGVLICGVPGTGKTAAAKETARILDVPLIQFDISRLQTKSYGGSEEQLRRYLDRISAFGSCVMLMDEIEKVFTINESTHEVKRAMLSLLLDWMQTRKANVLTFITANDISSIPPELLRDGRISGRFFAFMPARDDLCAILQLKLRELAGSDLFATDFAGMISSSLERDNPFAKMFDRIAERAREDRRNLFMTGANIEVLVEMTNREMLKETNGGFSTKKYLETMENCALSQSFIPQGQSNMEDIVNIWLAAEKRQYQDVSATAILPFSEYNGDGTFKEVNKRNKYDEYLRDVLKGRIKEIVEKEKERQQFMRRHS